MPMQVRFINQPRLQVRVVALPGNVIDVFGRTGHVTAQFGDYTAAQVINVPSGLVTATDVQAAINQLASGGGVTPAALTKTDDVNVTVTLGGTPATALLQAASITLGWTSTLSVGRGGSGTSTLTANGVLLGNGTSALIPVSPGSTGTVLTSPGGGGAPTWTAGTSVFSPSPLLDVDDTNVTLAWSGASLTAVNGTATLTAGWTGTLAIPRGGIGTSSWAGTNSIVASGVNATGTIQVVANSATTGTVMRSNGAAALPSFGVALVPGGGTGSSTWATNTVVIGGATATGTFQQVTSGVSGTFLMSQGPGVAPTYASPGAVTTIIGTDSRLQNLGFTCSVTSSSLTITLTGADGNAPAVGNEVVIDFRSQTGTISNSSSMTLTSASSLTISSGSTLGVTSATAFRLWVVGFNDAGTFRLGVTNCLTATSLFSLNDGLASSTAEGGAGAADSAGVIYTGSAVTSKPMRILGFLEWSASGLVTAGTWTVTNLILLQVLGPGVPLPGQTLQTTMDLQTGVMTGSTQVPLDDTIPTNTEGDQYFSAAIVPRSAANRLVIDAGVWGAHTAAAGFIVSLYQDSSASLATVGTVIASAGFLNAIGLHYEMRAGTASSTTFKIRVGGTSAGTITINGQASAREFGGVGISGFTIRELMG